LAHIFRLCVLNGCSPVPAMTESPFAWLGRYPAQESVVRSLDRRYPTLLAPTDSCARPQASGTLCLRSEAPVFAGCCETLLAGGPSRRYLRKSFPRCLVPYPGASPGAPTRYFPGDLGLYQLGNGSATRTHAVRRLLYGGPSRGCRHSLMFRPLGLLATQVAPTAGPHRDSGQPWLLRPSISRFVTLPCLGYASRPNRAIDGVGTHTPLDLRPCRPLPQAGTPWWARPPRCEGRWLPSPPPVPVPPRWSGRAARCMPPAHGITNGNAAALW